MNLNDLAERFGLKVYSGRNELTRTIGGGYVGDLLSDVMANGRKDDLWITLQVHPNVVAVAALKELAGVVLINGREPAPETAERADKEGVPVLGTALSAFEFAGKLYVLGVRGR